MQTHSLTGDAGSEVDNDEYKTILVQDATQPNDFIHKINGGCNKLRNQEGTSSNFQTKLLKLLSSAVKISRFYSEGQRPKCEIFGDMKVWPPATIHEWMMQLVLISMSPVHKISKQ